MSGSEKTEQLLNVLVRCRRRKTTEREEIPREKKMTKISPPTTKNKAGGFLCFFIFFFFCFLLLQDFNFDFDFGFFRLILEEVKFLQKQRERKSGIPAIPTVQAVVGGLAPKAGEKGDGGDGEKDDLVLQDTFAQETAVTIEDPNM